MEDAVIAREEREVTRDRNVRADGAAGAEGPLGHRIADRASRREADPAGIAAETGPVIGRGLGSKEEGARDPGGDERREQEQGDREGQSSGRRTDDDACLGMHWRLLDGRQPARPRPLPTGRGDDLVDELVRGRREASSAIQSAINRSSDIC